jgi:two-component system, chemotaxis family, sensor kinase CheA
MAQFIDDSLLKDYFDEAFSQIEVIEDNLLIIEKDPTNKDAIDSLFRAAHTLKGGSATVQMDEITDFTHLLEDVLDEVREGRIRINEEIVDIMLNALDLIKNMVNARSKGKIYNKDYSELIDKIRKIIESVEKKESKTTSKSGGQPKKDLPDNLLKNFKYNQIL